MKRILSSMLVLLLAVNLLFGIGCFPASAAERQKEVTPRSIGIVFDNSASMYRKNNKAWCRATYAIEVFATMLNDGDRLSVYPMHPVMIDDKTFDMQNPVVINGSNESQIVRKMFTPKAAGTPIETIDAAYQGLKNAQGERWLIVLTDGTTFYENGHELKKNTRQKLDERLGRYCKEMNVLYLGVGANAVTPVYSEGPSTRAYVDKASNSQDVLAKLTSMCNLIFGRDCLPDNHVSGSDITFDVSLSKLIVFVQGENVSGVSVTDAAGNPVGVKAGENQTRFSEMGSGESGKEVDKSLQGMVVTYNNCAAGSYKIQYSGDATSIETYYEPDVDLAFTFTDSNGKPVNPQALYEGDYAVGFGMKDAKTGEYTNSDLLGTTKYNGNYYLNGEVNPFESTEKSGICNVHLNKGDSFNADITAEYLSGYKIHKDGRSFGWPESGLSVAARPAGELTLKIDGGEEVYHLATLDQGQPFTAAVYYEGKQLTGKDLENTALFWDSELSGAELVKEFRDDHYDIVLRHKDENNPEATKTGEYTIPITARFTPKGCSEAESMPVDVCYGIDDSEVAIRLKLDLAQSYYQISKLGEGEPIRAELTSHGKPLTADQFSRVDFKAECSGIRFDTEALADESAFLIHFKTTDGINPGKYPIVCDASIHDEIGRTGTDQDDSQVKLGLLPMWLNWLILIIILLVILIIILIIMHIHKLPKYAHTTKKDTVILLDGSPVTKTSSIDGVISKNTMKITSKINGKPCGLQMNVKPGDSSYLKTPQAKRSALVESASIRKFGNATIQEVIIGTARYVLNEDTRKLERMPNGGHDFLVKNGARISYSGVIQNRGEMQNFSVSTKLNFKKKAK